MFKAIAWLITLLLKWGQDKIDEFLDVDKPLNEAVQEAKIVAYEPLAAKLIAMDQNGDLAALESTLRKLRDKALGIVYPDSDSSGQ